MASFRAEIVVDAAREDAFDYLSDLTNLSDWDSSVRRATAETGGGSGVGSKYDVTLGFYGKALDTKCEIVEHNPAERVRWVVSGKANGETSIMITDVEGQTIVTYDGSLKMAGFARFLDRGMQVAYDGIGENIVKGIAKQLRLK